MSTSNFPVPGPVQAVDPLPVGSMTNKWRVAGTMQLPPSISSFSPLFPFHFPVALPGDGSQGSARTSHTKNRRHKRAVAVDFGGATGLNQTEIIVIAIAAVMIAKYWFKA